MENNSPIEDDHAVSSAVPVTQVLADVSAGRIPSESLLPLVYQELRRLADVRMSHEPAGLTLQPTALVHEAWLRLLGAEAGDWDSRAHFFAAAAESMRRILVENARRRKRIRHGGQLERVPLEEIVDPAPGEDDRLLSLNEALTAFSAESPEKAELVKLRFFAGLSEQEAADALQISRPTAARWWVWAKAWLHDHMSCRKDGTSACSSGIE
ncbi:MAG: RNA polymerase subunit sigma [Planctomycetaceae bacterium]|nr:RNA polymerase subunit sigma [Planctomycetaceae bacterium]